MSTISSTSSAAPAPAKASKQPKASDSHFVYELFILGCIYVLAFCTRLFSVIRYESIIHEFDPWFNFRVSKYLVAEGFYDFHNWFDDKTWYPLGRYIGGTLYPGLMWTAGLLYHITNTLHLTMDIRNVCVLLAPFMASNTTIVAYLYAKETWNSRAGILAAAFMSLVPGYISRSVAGSYDNEAVAIFALTSTFFLWCRAVNTGSMLWGAACALAYFYMVAAWGGYIFIINIIPVHVMVLLVAGRYSSRLYVAYCTFFILGLIMSMTVPFVSFIPVTSPEHLPSIGVFGLLQLYSFFYFVKNRIKKDYLQPLIYMTAFLVLALIAAVIVLGVLGYVPFLTGRLLSLLGSTKNIAIVKSVSEHQPSPWTTYFFDFNCLVMFMPVGIYYSFQKLSDVTLFSVCYVLAASYFTGIMVRLVLVLAPAACVLSAIGVSETLYLLMDIVANNSDEASSPLEAEEAQEKAKAEAEAENDDETSSVASTRSARKKGPVSVEEKIKLAQKKKQEQREKKKKKDKYALLERTSGSLDRSFPSKVLALAVAAGITLILIGFVVHCTWVTSIAYSSPSVVLQARNHDGSRTIFDDFREAYYWLDKNTAPDAKIMSWWDYGYQITGMGNKSTIVDNNTRNNTHIATVGLAMASTEEDAYPILRMLDVDYVLVVFGGMIGYSSDDINKFLWMVRISGGVFPRIVESDYFGHGQYRVDKLVSKTMRNSLMYKMCYYRFDEMHTAYGQPTGYDRVRNCEIGHKGFSLSRLEEAYTTEHWMVRIYRVKKEVENIGGAVFPSLKKPRKIKLSKSSRKRRCKAVRKERRKQAKRLAKSRRARSAQAEDLIAQRQAAGPQQSQQSAEEQREAEIAAKKAAKKERKQKKKAQKAQA